MEASFKKESTMDEILNGKSIKVDFEAQATAAQMIQSNALIPLKLAARLCCIPKQEILKRIDHPHVHCRTGSLENSARSAKTGAPNNVPVRE